MWDTTLHMLNAAGLLALLRNAPGGLWDFRLANAQIGHTQRVAEQMETCSIVTAPAFLGAEPKTFTSVRPSGFYDYVPFVPLH